MINGKHTVTDNLQKANVLNSQFKSVFTEEQDGPLPDKRPFPHQIMSSIDITTSRIDTPLSNLNTPTTVGQDGINSRVLKEMHNSIAPILKVTFNCSINTGVVPNDWKAANIKFLFKKVD